MDKDEDLIKIRDCFREAADIIDEMLMLSSKEAGGEDVKKELESITGRFMFKMMELQSMK